MAADIPLTPRKLLPDLLKGIAAYLMIQVHVMELLIDSGGQNGFAGSFSLFLGGPFAAVIFMVVMGYFVAKNNKSAGRNLLRGMKLILLGLLLNIGLNFNLLLKIRFEGWQINPLEYIFGVDILFLAGLSTMILALLKTGKSANFRLALALLAVILVLTGPANRYLFIANHHYLLPFIAGPYSWSYFPVFPWLAYPLAGYLFSLQEKEVNKLIERYRKAAYVLLLAMAAAVLFFFSYGFNITTNLPEYYHHTWKYALWATGLVVAWAMFIHYIANNYSHSVVIRFLAWSGRNITLFYCIQWLIIGNLATANYRIHSIWKFIPFFLVISLLTAILTWAALQMRTRFSFFSGRKS